MTKLANEQVRGMIPSVPNLRDAGGYATLGPSTLAFGGEASLDQQHLALLGSWRRASWRPRQQSARSAGGSRREVL